MNAARGAWTGTRRLGEAAALLLPLLYGVACAAADGHVGTAARLLFATLGDDARLLSAPAPLLGKLLALLPFGPLPLRIALASSLALALLSLAVYRTADALLRAQGSRHDELVVPIALATSLFVAGAPGLFFDAMLPSPLCLQAALALLTLAQITALELAWPRHDLRPLYRASVYFGLALGNDPLSALSLLPALVPTLSRVLHARGALGVARSACLALGVAAACHAGPLTHTDGALFRLLGAWSPGGFAGTMQALRSLAGELGIVGLLAVLGAVAAYQTHELRRIAVTFVLAAIVAPAVHGFLAPRTEDETSLGMLSYALAACVLLAAAFFGALLAPSGKPKAALGRSETIAAAVLLALCALRLHATAERNSLSELALWSGLSGVSRHALPERALVLLRDPEHATLFIASESLDRARPDLTPLPISAFHDPATLALQRELRPLLRTYLLEGELTRAELESLAARRPVLLDMEPSVHPSLYDALRPAHLFYEVLGASVSRPEERLSAASFARDIERALESSGVRALHAAAPRRMLGRKLRAAALYFAGAGDRAALSHAIDLGLSLEPDAPLWPRLAAVAQASGPTGAIDVHALLPVATQSGELRAGP